MYADDSAILVADKSISNVEMLLQKELEVVSDWLIDNKLSLHPGKIKCILLGSKIRLKSQSTLNISYKGTDIERKESVKLFRCNCRAVSEYLVLTFLGSPAIVYIYTY